MRGQVVVTSLGMPEAFAETPSGAALSGSSPSGWKYTGLYKLGVGVGFWPNLDEVLCGPVKGSRMYGAGDFINRQGPW